MNNLFSYTARTFLGLLKALSTLDYWASLFFRLLSVSFVAVLWVYLGDVAKLDLSRSQILLYFGSIAAFQYLYTYDFANIYTEILDSELEEALLAPKSVLYFVFRNKFIPIALNSLIIFIPILTVGLAVGQIDIQQLPLMAVAYVLANIYFFFFCISMTIIGKYLNWSEYIGFSMRFIGFTWNGSYIPFAIFTGTLSTILYFTPFMPSGLFLQPIWDRGFDISLFLLPVVVGSIFWVILGLFLNKTYLEVKRT